MFEAETYIKRRNRLREMVGSGLILFPGNEETPMNYRDNAYHFRQDSSFLYYFGLDSPSLAGVVDADEGKDIIFGDDADMDDIIWMGHQALLKVRGKRVGVEETTPLSRIADVLDQAVKEGKKIHFLPPYRPETILKLADWLHLDIQKVALKASADLIIALAAQRSLKTDEEIQEIEKALDVSYEMHTLAMKMAKPGVYESEITGRMEGLVLSRGFFLAFPTILTINGQILHNHYHGNVLKEGRLLVNDSGAESDRHYASDITRTTPVGGKFSSRQKEIYEVVLKAQTGAIDAMRPGISFRDVHLLAARTIAGGLTDLGIMKGDPEEAVDKGAHAMFFPHGLGHLMGLDVHDMENIGENYVGYGDEAQRSSQFGLSALRFAKKLEPGHVLTVEPGLYFIPDLIDLWKNEGKFTNFIDYDKVNNYRDFGGIRIEDDVLVTENGHRILGKPIPKTIADIEKTAAEA